MNLVFVQSCNSSQDLCHCVPSLLQEHYVVLHVVWILWNGEIKTPRKSHHNQWFHQNQFFGPFHVQKVENNNRNMHLKIGYCDYYWVLVTMLIPDTIGNRSLEREHPFLTEFSYVWTADSFSTTHRLKNMSMQFNQKKSFRQQRLVFCQICINFIVFEVQCFPLTVHDNFEVVCLSPEVYAYFWSAIIFCPV